MLTQFYLFLDENYYLANKSRPLISFLEHLYAAQPPKLDKKEVRQQIVATRDILRAAVSRSPVLSKLSDDDLERVFRINVNITNPFDPAFPLDVSSCAVRP